MYRHLQSDCTPGKCCGDVSNASGAPVTTSLKPLRAVTPVMSAVVLNTPFVAVKFVPAIAVETKSAIASFLLGIITCIYNCKTVVCGVNCWGC